VWFERPNVYLLNLTSPLDRILFKADIPVGLRELPRPKEAVEAWDLLEASFYPDGVAEFSLVRREKTKDGYVRADRYWVETITADDLWRGLHPERILAPLITSLAGELVPGPIARLGVWTVFDRLVLRANNRRLRSVLPTDHWLILEMNGIQTEVGRLHSSLRHRMIRPVPSPEPEAASNGHRKDEETPAPAGWPAAVGTGR
jgi:hypothetical protein